MTRTPSQAMAWANTVTSGYGGMCLQFVRLAFDIPARYGTARAARLGSRLWHPTTNPAAVPAGYPVYLGDNHVALSTGGGNMRTTNSVTKRVSTVPIASWGKSYPLRGWAGDLNGVTIPGDAASAPTPSPSRVLRRGSTGPEVGNLQKVLNTRYPLYSKLVVDSIYGAKTEAVVRELQRRAGLAVDGIAGAATLGYLGL